MNDNTTKRSLEELRVIAMHCTKPIRSTPNNDEDDCFNYVWSELWNRDQTHGPHDSNILFWLGRKYAHRFFETTYGRSDSKQGRRQLHENTVTASATVSTETGESMTWLEVAGNGANYTTCGHIAGPESALNTDEFYLDDMGIQGEDREIIDRLLAGDKRADICETLGISRNTFAKRLRLLAIDMYGSEKIEEEQATRNLMKLRGR